MKKFILPILLLFFSTSLSAQSTREVKGWENPEDVTEIMIVSQFLAMVGDVREANLGRNNIQEFEWSDNNNPLPNVQAIFDADHREAMLIVRIAQETQRKQAEDGMAITTNFCANGLKGLYDGIAVEELVAQLEAERNEVNAGVVAFFYERLRAETDRTQEQKIKQTLRQDVKQRVNSTTVDLQAFVRRNNFDTNSLIQHVCNDN